MKKDFDIIVIGAGAGGLNIASFMKSVGFSTLLIEKDESRIGGDCLNVGCIPSKALIHVARKVYSAYDTNRFGVETRGVADFKLVRKHIEEAQAVIREHESADYFRQKGIEVVIGEAVFAGPDSVMVGQVTYTAKRIVLAVGTKPRTLDLPGIENANVHTNETIFTLDRLPKRLAVIGGGPIGVELGQAFAMLGSEVSLVTRDARLLPREDEEVSGVLQRKLEEMNVQLYFNSSPKRFEGKTRLMIELPGGLEHQLGYDVCLSAIGRESVTDSLNLDFAGIQTDERGQLQVNEYLQTTNSQVFVVGDAAGAHQFTHAAELHASLVLSNFFKPGILKKKLNTDHMGWVTYTSPEIASFGLSEAKLAERSKKYELLRVPFTHDDRAITDENREGLMKLFVDPNQGTIYGGSIVAEGAGEIVGELMLAQRHQMNLGDLFKKVYPYPTASRINRAAAQKFMGRKLSERAKRLLHFLY